MPPLTGPLGLHVGSPWLILYVPDPRELYAKFGGLTPVFFIILWSPPVT